MKTCTQCQSSFEVTDADRKFYDSVSPIFNGQKYAIPEPTHCPDCRQQRRLSFCNESNLYSGKCGLCKKRLITEYHRESGQPIYCRDCWNSDEWDGLSYGRDFDFNRPFFRQILELRKSTPSLALCTQGTNVNCDYIHYAGSSKNCYLIMHADFCENCYYGYGFKKNTYCVDGFYNLHCEWCYDCVYIHKSYGLTGCQDCVNCHSSAFLRDCIGCKNCFLCVGLREKEYCFENKQLTKEEYEKRMATIDLGSHAQYQKYQARLRALEQKHTFKEYQGHNLQNSSGNYLQNCKDLQESFDCEDVERGRFCYQIVLGSKNIYDIYQYGSNLQESYDCSIVGENSYHLLFCENCHMNCSDLIYCWYMQTSRDCFGCAGLDHKRFCILNKQYTEAEYNDLVPKIIDHMKETGEWGQFFPSSLSLFGYNKTTAQMYYPLKKEQALAKGFHWDDYESPPSQVEKVIPAGRLPDNIKDIPDDVINWAIVCETTEKPFKITKNELDFYRKQGVPLPRRSPQQRHLDRFARRNPRHLFDRQCDKCSANIKTTYCPDRPETVYCEACYLGKVY